MPANGSGRKKWDLPGFTVSPKHPPVAEPLLVESSFCSTLHPKARKGITETYGILT